MAATAGRSKSDTGPGEDYFNITPHDSNDFTTSIRELIVGAAGNVALVKTDNTVVILPLGVGRYALVARRVNATNTTAASLIGVV